MEFSDNENKLRFFYGGICSTKLEKESSKNYLKELQEHKLITIDPAKKVFLTDRGRVAKRIGINKYLRIEKFEKELIDGHTSGVETKNFIVLAIITVLLFVTSVLLIYVSWIVDFQ